MGHNLPYQTHTFTLVRVTKKFQIKLSVQTHFNFVKELEKSPLIKRLSYLLFCTCATKAKRDWKICILIIIKQGDNLDLV